MTDVAYGRMAEGNALLRICYDDLRNINLLLCWPQYNVLLIKHLAGIFTLYVGR